MSGVWGARWGGGGHVAVEGGDEGEGDGGLRPLDFILALDEC